MLTRRQAQVTIAVSVILLTGLLLRSAAETGEWIGFVVTELQIAAAFGAAWWAIAARLSP